jgi:hypothetical protein
MQIRKRIINWKDPVQREKALKFWSKASFGADALAYFFTALIMPILLVNASPSTILTDVTLFIGLLVPGTAMTYILLRRNRIWHLVSFEIAIFSIAILALVNSILGLSSGESIHVPASVCPLVFGWLVGQGIGRLLDRIVK